MISNISKNTSPIKIYHPFTGLIRKRESNPIAPWKIFPPEKTYKMHFLISEGSINLEQNMCKSQQNKHLLSQFLFPGLEE